MNSKDYPASKSRRNCAMLCCDLNTIIFQCFWSKVILCILNVYVYIQQIKGKGERKWGIKA